MLITHQRFPRGALSMCLLKARCSLGGLVPKFWVDGAILDDVNSEQEGCFRYGIVAYIVPTEGA